MMNCLNQELLAKNWDILETRMDQRGDHMKTNFDYFQIQKWMPQTIRAEKIDGKNWVICLVSIFPSRVMVLNCLKKCNIFNFVLTSARNLSILKQFTYIHLKGLVEHFQEMVFFIILWFTDLDILGFEVKELCESSTESVSFLIF